MGLLDRYKGWVRNNATQIGIIDQALTSLTWLMPDRFSGTEFAAEAIDASVALLRLYNESILQPTPPAAAGRGQIPWPFWLAVIREVRMSVAPSSRQERATRWLTLSYSFDTSRYLQQVRT